MWNHSSDEVSAALDVPGQYPRAVQFGVVGRIISSPALPGGTYCIRHIHREGGDDTGHQEEREAVAPKYDDYPSRITEAVRLWHQDRAHHFDADGHREQHIRAHSA